MAAKLESTTPIHPIAERRVGKEVGTAIVAVEVADLAMADIRMDVAMAAKTHRKATIVWRSDLRRHCTMLELGIISLVYLSNF